MRQLLEILATPLAVGLAFVWLFGFAVGYQDPVTPVVLGTLAISLAVCSIWLKKNPDIS